MAEASRLDLIARFQIPEGRLEDLKSLAAQCLAAVREKDPGTLRYDWYLDESDTECVVVETYDSSEALLAHFQTVEGPLGEALEFLTVELELYGEPSPELREALIPLGARFFSYLQGFRREARREDLTLRAHSALAENLDRAQLLERLEDESWRVKHEVLTRWAWCRAQDDAIAKEQVFKYPFRCEVGPHERRQTLDREFWCLLRFLPHYAQVRTSHRTSIWR